MEDVLDAYTLAFACQHFGLEDFGSKPTAIHIPALAHLQSDQAKASWLLQQAKAIRVRLLSPEETMDIDDIALQVSSIDQREQQLQNMQQENGKFQCPHCDKAYIRQGNVVNHLKKVHQINLDSLLVHRTSSEETSARSVIASFCRMAYLYRDTVDAYKMADGNRIFRNAKLEMLYAYSLKHTKYRLWLWRMLAYEMALLSEREAFDYKWNTCTNLSGGIRRNIPNDNAVEIQVGEIKKRFQREGPNKSFASAQLICKTNQITTKIAKNLQRETTSKVRSRKRPAVDKMKDIKTMVEEIQFAKVFDSSTKYVTFKNYLDPLARLDMGEFHKWVQDQKAIAAVKMIKNAHL